jgi:hypothetical protein
MYAPRDCNPRSSGPDAADVRWPMGGWVALRSHCSTPSRDAGCEPLSMLAAALFRKRS